MKWTLVAIRDRKANCFNRPVAVQSTGQAIRSFQDEINRADQNNDLYKHPGDFDLYHVGFFVDETGEMISLNFPEQIACGEELKYRSE